MPVKNIIIGMEGSGAEEYGYTLFSQLLKEGSKVTGYTDWPYNFWAAGDSRDLSRFQNLMDNHCYALGQRPQNPEKVIAALKQAREGEYIFLFGACFLGLEDNQFNEVLKWIRRTDSNVICLAAQMDIKEGNSLMKFNSRFYALQDLTETLTLTHLMNHHIDALVEDKAVDFPILKSIDAFKLASIDNSIKYPCIFQEVSRDGVKSFHFDIHGALNS